MKISIVISVYNEAVEIQRLLSLLKERNKNIEVIVCLDKHKATHEVKSILKQFSDIKIVEEEFNKDFADFKNRMFSYASGEYILNLDADEYLPLEVLNSLEFVLDEYPDIDLFHFPRINTVDGITNEYVRENNWKIDNNGWINFPDFQGRLIKNNGKLKWKGLVHEKLTSDTKFIATRLPPEFAIIHPKTFERQKKQNELYKNIDSGN